MRFGYFDDKNKEYVITRPDTPRSWSNYLGSTEYGAIITNNAGGYSFYKSAAQGRFIRLRFNTIPMDQPGRILYIHDRENHDYWSASWQPVGKPLNQYRSECRHGTAYTSILSEYSDIEIETRYFVPLNDLMECWIVRITNKGRKKRKLRLFTFVEYACNWNAADDLNNLQYTQYIATMNVINNIIDHGTNVFIPPQPDNFEEKDQGRHTFQAIVGAEITGYDTDREKFLGRYRHYGNPVVVENGKCTNSLAYGDNPCGTLQVDMDLKAGESKTFAVLLGIGRADKEGKKAVKKYSDIRNLERELAKVKDHWQSRLHGLTVETPDEDFNSMMNMWSPFNCLITYAWSRAASLVYAGARDGLGYRDTLQDMLGVMHNIPSEAKERLELMITGQVSTGGALPVVKPFAHHPGKERKPAEHDYRSDDCLWLFNAIPAYVRETGDLAFYDKMLPYADEGEDSVLHHMKRAIQFNIKRSGSHGLPCGLSADWNDCLELGHHGESVFVAFQLRFALKTYLDICHSLKNQEEEKWASLHLAKLDDNLKKQAWDGQWFIRAIREDGFKFGSKQSKEGKVWLNPQSWAVYSEHITGKQAIDMMDQVNNQLATEFGLALCDPPYEKTDPAVIKATLFNKGMKENGAIFCHTQGWAIIAETMLGHGNRAYTYFRAFMPSAYNDIAEIREIEPYVYCQSTHARYSPRFGSSRLPWLSGAATWSYYAATQYILGIQPRDNGMVIDPCIPSEWKNFKMTRLFRGKQLNIHVQNKMGIEKGVNQIIINDEKIEGNTIPINKIKSVNTIHVQMG